MLYFYTLLYISLKEESGFPISILPQTVDAPSLAGYTHSSWHGIGKGTPVGVAMGDAQCSVFAAQPSFTDAGIV